MQTQAKTKGRIVVIVLCVAGLAAAYLFTRERTPPAPKAEAKVDAPPALPAGVAAVVIVDDDDQERGGIVAELPAETTDQPQARAYGLIKPLDGFTTLFNAIGAAQQQVRTAEIKFDAARAAATRSRDLQKVMPSAASQAEIAEAALRIEGAAVDTARAQLRGLRTQAIQDWGAQLGEALATQSTLAEELALRKSMLVQLTLPADLPPPPRAILSLSGGEPVEARLLSPATQAEARLAGPSFFYLMPTQPAALTGASVVAALPKGAPRRAVAIKAASVVWQAGKPWIYVKAGANRFERRGLGDEATPTADGGYAVPSWPKGQALVVVGAQALLTEETKAKRADEDDD